MYANFKAMVGAGSIGGKKQRIAKRLAAAALALAIGTAATAQAADFCMTLGGETLVGKRFKIPAKGKCASFNGFMPAYGSKTFSGNACTASDGSRVDFNLVQTYLNFYGGAHAASYFHLIQLNLPALTGTDYWNYPNSDSHSQSSVAVFPCAVVPIP